MKQLKITTMALLLFVTSSAGAATLNFQFLVADSVFSGTLLGDLQDDNDTFFVTQALVLTLDDYTIDVSNYYVGQYSTLNDDLPNGTPIDPSIMNIGIVSLSGQNINLTVCDREMCGFGVVMSNNIPSFADDFFAYLSPGDRISTAFSFDETNWSAQVVPLPAAGWLFLGALFWSASVRATEKQRDDRPRFC